MRREWPHFTVRRFPKKWSMQRKVPHLSSTMPILKLQTCPNQEVPPHLQVENIMTLPMLVFVKAKSLAQQCSSHQSNVVLTKQEVRGQPGGGEVFTSTTISHWTARRASGHPTTAGGKPPELHSNVTAGPIGENGQDSYCDSTP